MSRASRNQRRKVKRVREAGFNAGPNLLKTDDGTFVWTGFVGMNKPGSIISNRVVMGKRG